MQRMKNISITKKIGIKDVYSSNIFLRKLWTLLNNNALKEGRTANGWQYSTYRLNEKENWFSIGSCNEAGEVLVQLNNQGGIEIIGFVLQNQDKDAIEEIVNTALGNTLKTSPYKCTFVFDSYGAKCADASFGKVLFTNSDNRILVSIGLNAYCQEDARYIISNIRPYVLGLLFSYYKNNIRFEKNIFSQEDVITDSKGYCEKQKEWFDYDEVPINNKGEYIVQIQLLKTLNILPSIVERRNNPIFDILNSSRNISLAYGLLSTYLSADCIERLSDRTLLEGYVNGIIMSSIESLATRGTTPTRCELCGQPVYSISKRVYDYIESNFNQTLAGEAKFLYNKRSKLFHENRISLFEYGRLSWPQLLTDKKDKDLEKMSLGDYKTKNVFANHNTPFYINFIDYTIFLIRKELDTFWQQNNKDSFSH